MLPTVFGENLFDDFFDDSFGMMNARSPLYGKHARNLMKTDIRETDTNYELAIDLPGFKKDEIHIELKNGYLTISAAKGLDKDEKAPEGKYIRQERYTGACSRSFYVGTDLQPKDVSAKFTDGILDGEAPPFSVRFGLCPLYALGRNYRGDRHQRRLFRRRVGAAALLEPCRNTL